MNIEKKSKERERNIMKKIDWGLSYEEIRDDFLSEPESLKKCVDEYFSNDGKQFFDQVISTLLELDIKRVLFIGNTFNHFSSHISHYVLSKSTKPIPFVWQILELSEFFNYFLPQERLEKPHYNSLYIFISKSGSSRLLVKSIRQLKLLNMNKKLVWLVSNNRNPPIKDSIGYLFPTYVEEELVLGTKSFISTILVLYLISIALQGINPINENTHTALINLFTNLTDYRNNWYKITEEVMDFIGDNYSFFYFISREPASYATAAVSALSTMSFTRILSESISLGLFFHGPFQVLSDDYICFILIGDQLNKESKTLLERLTNQISKKLKSGRVILISNDITCCTNNEHIYTIQYECNINALSPIFEFNILQYIFLNIAKKRGVI